MGILQNKHGLSGRRACCLVGLHRSTAQYQPVGRDDTAVRDRLKALAAANRRYGYLRLHALLRREGLVINHKRTWRLYSIEGLRVRTKKRVPSCPDGTGCQQALRAGRCSVGPWISYRTSGPRASTCGC
jgi:hypothetical protein